MTMIIVLGCCNDGALSMSMTCTAFMSILGRGVFFGTLAWEDKVG